MTTIDLALVSEKDFPNVLIATWGTIGNGDDGKVLEFPQYADKTISVNGTLGSGGTLVVEGSNDGTNWTTLTDPQGNALSITAVDRVEVIQENTRFLRPRASAGDGSTAFDVTIVAVKGAR